MKANPNLSILLALCMVLGVACSGEETDKENYYRRERCYGKFERAFTLPENVDADNIKADYKDGVLEVHVPKPEEKKPRQITVH